MTQLQHDLLTVRQVADRLRVDPATVRRWIASGRLGSYRTLGGHLRVSEAELQQRMADLGR